ncbi:MAG: phosphate ABC transporter permease subunit PstC [Candidatus Eremiobacteraeota bacterium]|nr:phosphate ABC transporter permease subunit PstC [Candidatus Eremiobacteraeota bacterium]MBV8366721.1 phosphate ABC transporter permease subunit PstC [Candidatus Eremiobacteraeota bacterium]
MSQESAEVISATAGASARAARTRISPAGDRIFMFLLYASAWFVLAIVAALFLVLLQRSWPAIQTIGLGVFTQLWDPGGGHFGVLTFIYGTIVTSAIALLIAGPVGIGAALFLAELAPKRLATPVAMLIELLAAVPSVVYGIWGLFVLVPVIRMYIGPALQHTFGFLPLFQGPIYGVGMLAGGLILSIMVVPTVAAISRDVFEAVPNDQREGMLALGSTKWEMMTKAVLPYARSGVVGALVLGLGRALGEAMAVVMVIGNKPQIVASLFQPAYTMASVPANEFSEATGKVYISALIEVGLLLFIVSLLVNISARLLVWNASGRGRR